MLRPLTASLAVTLLLLVALLLPAAAASAHPFGPPPSALLTARGNTLTIEWRSTPDDAAAIGVALGFMDPAVLDQYLEAATQVAPSSRDEEALSASPELRAYLAERIIVRQDGEPCEGTVPAIPDFVHGGAQVIHRCPEPIGEVEVEIAMLHDVHEAYRTFGISESAEVEPAQAVFTLASPVQRIDFSAVTDASGGAAEEANAIGGSGGGAARGIAVLVGVLALGLGGALLVAGRGRGRGPGDITAD